VPWEGPIIGPGTHSTSRVAGSAQLFGQHTFGIGDGTFDFTNDKNEYATRRGYDNVPTLTGREALIRLPAPDPFLTPGREFIVLARFDGVKMTAAGEDEDAVMPILTLVSYEEPNSLLVY
jgi:hypothetical protein